MKIYTEEMLSKKTKQELTMMLDGVRTSIYLTNDEKAANIDILEYKLGYKKADDKIAYDIMQGQPDYDDIN